ncbi:AraC family transcriptional regulator [Streptomyces syringium]|uniref:AraC family transcriptional regulator n=1 Tax=Streptomyces syringium TaxID=76729 RepID=UPI0036591528
MDALGDLLRGVRADGALFGRWTVTAPWSLRFADGAPLTLCTLVRGTGWLVPAEGEPLLLRRGDTALVRGPAPFTFVDALTAAPEDASGPSAELVSGAYRSESDIGRRLTGALPPVLIVPDEGEPEGCGVLHEFIAAEVAADKPGQQFVLDRLMDWMLVCTLRAWFERPEACPPAWYRALGDPVVGAALRAMHDAPARPWTIAALAAGSGVSRASLAKRFTELVGEPPLAYLTGWRMTLAAELLAEPEATVSGVARRVGYADGFAFSAAFKRERGLSPSAHRATRVGADREPVGA